MIDGYWKFICPYCGTENVVPAKIGISQTATVVANCCFEDGGCEAQVIVDIKLIANISVREIEGQREAFNLKENRKREYLKHKETYGD